MSEKMQGKSAMMRDRMLAHYGDELHHKHNRNHMKYPSHLKPAPLNGHDDTAETVPKWSHDAILDFKERKTRKRLDKGRIH